MTKSDPNENGVYGATYREVVASRGRSYAEVTIAYCEDGLYRAAWGYQYSYGGASSPIFAVSPANPTLAAARGAAMEQLLRRWPSAWPSEPASVHEELRELRLQLELQLRQPSFL